MRWMRSTIIVPSRHYSPFVIASEAWQSPRHSTPLLPSPWEKGDRLRWMRSAVIIPPCHCKRSVAIPSSFNTPPAFSLGEGEPLAVDEVYHHCPTSSLLSLCHCERSVAIPSSVHPAIQLRSLAVMHSPLRLSKNFATLLKISIWANSFKNTSSVKPAKVNAEVSLSPSLACLRK